MGYFELVLHPNRPNYRYPDYGAFLMIGRAGIANLIPVRFHAMVIWRINFRYAYSHRSRIGNSSLAEEPIWLNCIRSLDISCSVVYATKI
jgi:hypothetical protein